eukprot:TRINITY_DN61346_c0_g1_i1.p1 TRINITY_DN61346_c0_g1~~TRINITY_DN61346_c0_g1_i1.p1  ORF type:complete len:246 (-),score=22.41 TRINITY_DN61346_c0_g1_i1:509-1189(-)
MALFLACKSSQRTSFAILISIAAGVADAGFGKSLPSLSAGGLPSDVEVAKMLLNDAWVDLQITSNTSMLGKNLSDCRGNGSSGALSRVASSNASLLAASAGATSPAPPSVSGVLPQWPQMAAGREQRPLAIESHAVALSLLLENSCEKLRSRWCLRNSHASARELRPITVKLGDSHESKLVRSARELRPVTVTFGDSHASKLLRNVPSASNAPLITSLSHLGLEFA